MSHSTRKSQFKVNVKIVCILFVSFNVLIVAIFLSLHIVLAAVFVLYLYTVL